MILKTSQAQNNWPIADVRELEEKKPGKEEILYSNFWERPETYVRRFELIDYCSFAAVV